LELKVKDLEILASKKDFWDDQEKARAVLQKKTKLSDALDHWKRFQNQLRDIENLWLIASDEKDEQVISVDTAHRDAEKGNFEFTEELIFLIIHGLLHLTGYNHENTSKTDALKMKKKEKELFSVLVQSR